MTSRSESEIRAHLEQWATASRAMDVDAVMACYAPDAVSYDCHSVFALVGADAHRRHLELCYPHMRGPVTFDIHDLSLTASDEVAFCHFTLHCGCTGSDNQEHWCWLRATAGLRKIGGRWLITHDHCSAPFDPMSAQAMLDAAPEGLKKVA